MSCLRDWRRTLIATTRPAASGVGLGGKDAWASLLWLGAAAAAGSLAHVWARRDGGVRPRHALTLSLVVFVTTFASFALLGPRGLTLVERAWLPLLAISVVGTGVVARLFGDVVERAEAVDAHARFRGLIDDASDAIRIVDPDTLKILDVNPPDLEISGYTRGPPLGPDVRPFCPAQ